MKTSLRIALATIVLALAAPAASFAQIPTCPPGESFQPVSGQPGFFSCQPNSAPEISMSAGAAGAVLLAGAVFLIRGRKRIQTNA